MSKKKKTLTRKQVKRINKRREKKSDFCRVLRNRAALIRGEIAVANQAFATLAALSVVVSPACQSKYDLWQLKKAGSATALDASAAAIEEEMEAELEYYNCEMDGPLIG